MDTRRHQGAQGRLEEASNLALDNEFGTHQDEDVVKKILEYGEVKEKKEKERVGNTVRFSFNLTPPLHALCGMIHSSDSFFKNSTESYHGNIRWALEYHILHYGTTRRGMAFFFHFQMKNWIELNLLAAQGYRVLF